MPLFAIWRNLDPAMTESERNAMTVRSIGALEWFPNVRWIRSYVIEEPGRFETLCAYEASSVEELRATNLRCAVPFAEIRPVVELLPETGTPDHAGGELYMVLSGEPLETPAGIRWMRSYVDEEHGTHAAIYSAAPEITFEPSAATVESVTPVTEIHPSEWAWVYESLNVPKHWEVAPGRL